MVLTDGFKIYFPMNVSNIFKIIFPTRSFGCILYEMIENVPLINKSGQLQILMEILNPTDERSLTPSDHPLNDIFTR